MMTNGLLSTWTKVHFWTVHVMKPIFSNLAVGTVALLLLYGIYEAALAAMYDQELLDAVTLIGLLLLAPWLGDVILRVTGVRRDPEDY
jgi:hypothetical protein